MVTEWRDATLGDLLAHMASSQPNREAIVAGGERLTYRQFDEQVNAVARGLLALGVKKGDRVALLMTNRPQWLVTYFAAARIGGVLLALNTRYKDDECVYVLKHSRARVLITQDRFNNRDYLEMVADICPEVTRCQPGDLNSAQLSDLREVVVQGHVPAGAWRPFTDLEALGRGISEAELEQAVRSVGVHDTAVLLYTSGTTSFPKGVMLSHFSMIRNNFHVGERQGLTVDDRMLFVLPLASAFICVNGVIASMTHGSTMVLLESFDAEQTMATIQAERCTALYGVNTIFQGLLDHPSRSRYHLGSLRTGIGILTPQMAVAIRDVLNIPEFHQAYGMTESSAVSTMTSMVDLPEDRIDSMGKALPDTEVDAFNPDTGGRLPSGEMGELRIRGYSVMQGYYGNPEETGKAVDVDGWLHTGDLGVVSPSGNVRFRGRIKEMFKPGGFNVSSLEVEEVVRQHPAVRDTAVVGVPDSRMMEVGMAFVILEPGRIATAEKIQEFCNEHLANFKVPRYIRFVEGDFPRNSLGKVQKLQMRDEAVRELQLAGDQSLTYRYQQ